MVRPHSKRPLSRPFAEYGRAAKTLHLLAMCDPDDETYRRTVHVQLTVQESRHRLARKIFHGSRGVNAVVLWNTRYVDATPFSAASAPHAGG